MDFARPFLHAAAPAPAADAIGELRTAEHARYRRLRSDIAILPLSLSPSIREREGAKCRRPLLPFLSHCRQSPSSAGFDILLVVDLAKSESISCSDDGDGDFHQNRRRASEYYAAAAVFAAPLSGLLARGLFADWIENQCRAGLNPRLVETVRDSRLPVEEFEL